MFIFKVWEAKAVIVFCLKLKWTEIEDNYVLLFSVNQNEYYYLHLPCI